MQTNNICALFNEVKNICAVLEKYDKSKFNGSADMNAVSNWEVKNSIRMPEEVRTLLMLSNGFQVLGRTAEIYGLDKLGFLKDEISDDYVIVGELVGDGEYLCFHRETGKVVSVFENIVYDYSIADFLKYCIEQGVDGLFMINASDNDISGLSDYVKNKIVGIRKNMSVSARQLAHNFTLYSNNDKVKLMNTLPVLIQGIIYNTISVAEGINYVNYLSETDKVYRDNFIRGLRRRVLDNYFNRERQLLNDGKATYQWDRYQLEEVYNFTPDGNTFVNAGIVYDHDTNGNIKREVLTYRYEHFAINKVKMKTRNRYNISEHVEHAYEIQDIIIG